MLSKADKTKMLSHIRGKLFNHLDTGLVVTPEWGNLGRYDAIFLMDYGKGAKGARQTARDLFDAYVLSTQAQPIHSFLIESNQHGANYPQDAFCANILSMPWLSLMDEFEGLELLPPYLGLTLIGDIKPLLVNEAMTIQKLNRIDDENHA